MNFKIREIKIYPDRLNFACEYCLDSQKNPNAKRANLYFKNMFKVCFNESCNMSFVKMMKDNNIELDLQKKLDIYNLLTN